MLNLAIKIMVKYKYDKTGKIENNGVLYILSTTTGEGEEVYTTFEEVPAPKNEGDRFLFNASLCFIIMGDLSFYAVMLGHEGHKFA